MGSEWPINSAFGLELGTSGLTHLVVFSGGVPPDTADTWQCSVCPREGGGPGWWRGGGSQAWGVEQVYPRTRPGARPEPAAGATPETRKGGGVLSPLELPMRGRSVGQLRHPMSLWAWGDHRSSGTSDGPRPKAVWLPSADTQSRPCVCASAVDRMPAFVAHPPCRCGATLPAGRGGGRGCMPPPPNRGRQNDRSDRPTGRPTDRISSARGRKNRSTTVVH